jgi:hypothetical protein
MAVPYFSTFPHGAISGKMLMKNQSPRGRGKECVGTTYFG